jgi:hypothetical protein
MTHANVSARIKELKTAAAEIVVKIEIRKRSERVQVLQDMLHRMCRLRELRALEYADHRVALPGCWSRSTWKKRRAGDLEV